MARRKKPSGGDITPENIVETREQKVAAIQKFTLFSDVFARVVFEDVMACEHVLQILTKNTRLRLRWVKTQVVLSKLDSHDAWLDVLAESMDGAVFAMEIQMRNNVDHPHRVRFYEAMIDSYFLEKGKPYRALPDVTLVYVGKKDFLNAGVASWSVEKYQSIVGEHSDNLHANMKAGTKSNECGNSVNRKRYEDGLHTQYVNAEIDDGSDIAKLMRYFLTADPEDMSQGALSQRVRFLKCDEKGRDRMCEVTDLFWRSGYVIGESKGERRGEYRGKQIGREQGIHLTKQAQEYFAKGETKQEIAKKLRISRKELALMLD